MFEFFKSRDAKPNVTGEARRATSIINLSLTALESHIASIQTNGLLGFDINQCLSENDARLTPLFSQLPEDSRAALEAKYQALRDELLALSDNIK